MTGANIGKLDNCLKLSEAQMKNKESINLNDGSIITFLELLNKEGTYFIEDTKNSNKGYPVLE